VILLGRVDWRRVRTIAAWVLLIGSTIGWPLGALTVFRHEPQGVLGLSFLAIIIECGSLLTASQVREAQSDDQQQGEQ
jgi:uncharacterized membrane protein YfcA